MHQRMMTLLYNVNHNKRQIIAIKQVKQYKPLTRTGDSILVKVDYHPPFSKQSDHRGACMFVLNKRVPTTRLLDPDQVDFDWLARKNAAILKLLKTTKTSIFKRDRT